MPIILLRTIRDIDIKYSKEQKKKDKLVILKLSYYSRREKDYIDSFYYPDLFIIFSKFYAGTKANLNPPPPIISTFSTLIFYSTLFFFYY